MQRHAGSPDLFYQVFATGLQLVQVRRTKGLLSCSGKDEVGHLEIAHGPIVSCCKRVQFFCNA